VLDVQGGGIGLGQGGAEIEIAEVKPLVGIEGDGPVGAQLGGGGEGEVAGGGEVVAPGELAQDELLPGDVAGDAQRGVGDAGVDDDEPVDPIDDAAQGVSDDRLAVAGERRGDDGDAVRGKGGDTGTRLRRRPTLTPTATQRVPGPWRWERGSQRRNGRLMGTPSLCQRLGRDWGELRVEDGRGRLLYGLLRGSRRSRHGRRGGPHHRLHRVGIEGRGQQRQDLGDGDGC
jgi:hypothetical protein